MAEEQQNAPVDLGMFNRPVSRGLTPGDVMAIGLSAVWMLGCGGFFLATRQPGVGLEADTLTFVVAVIAIVLPVAMIWVAATAARSVHVMREEAARLQAALDALRQAHVVAEQSRHMQVVPQQGANGAAPATSQEGQASLPLPPATFQSRREAPSAVASSPPHGPASARASGGDQGTLALGAITEDHPPMPVNDFIRALNFPKTTEDTEGFRALRRGLKDPHVGRLIQASQDVLTLMSQDGIYMDDLTPDRARPEVWRKFAEGERGRAVAMLGGVRDRSSLALSAQRMRKDHIFRDAAHHFLRQFDRTFSSFEKTATDEEIAKLSDTRTARAFMLLGRVAGTFD